MTLLGDACEVFMQFSTTSVMFFEPINLYNFFYKAYEKINNLRPACGVNGQCGFTEGGWTNEDNSIEEICIMIK